MIPFDLRVNTRILFGVDSLAQIGNLVSELGGQRVLIVTDSGIKSAGHLTTACHYLTEKKIEHFVFSDVKENPNTDIVDIGVKFARQHQIDFIIGFGGGSSMDCAKGINFLYTNGGKMADYWGRGKAQKPMLPSIGIPTTAGTGSEAQCYALISDSKTHRKMACGDPKAAFKVALLDPKLTLTQPTSVAIITAIDAIAHALETAVTRKRNPISDLFAQKAWELLINNFDDVLSTPDDLEARSAMQLGACYSGVAIENSMLGATHSCANPLTKNWNITHGLAIAIMLPHVVRFNDVEVANTYQRLCDLVGWKGNNSPGEILAENLTELIKRAGLAQHISDYKVPEDNIGILASEATKEWTAQFNPREVTEEDFIKLYQAAY